jgi:hypothetical protein
MFCDQCQNILNLDIFLSTHEKHDSNNGKSRPHPHHDSFAALERAAKEGCAICKMISSNTNKWQLERLNSLTCSESRLFFKFVSLDLLKLTTANEEERSDSDDEGLHEPGPLLPEMRLSPKEGISQSLYEI